jgi:hypothetical protein
VHLISLRSIGAATTTVVIAVVAVSAAACSISHTGQTAPQAGKPAAATTSVSSAPTTATRPRQPACTHAAVQEAAQEAAAAYGGTIAGLEDFHCSGDFAYADADEKQQGNINSVTLLFKANGTRWVPVDRGTYCKNGSVPKAIYADACEYQ